MAVIGHRFIKMTNDALRYVVDNLKSQFIIPYCGRYTSSKEHMYNEKYTSNLCITISFKNLNKCKCEIFDCADDDKLCALQKMTDILLKKDVDSDYYQDDDAIIFGTAKYSYTTEQEFTVGSDKFLVTVTYERSYRSQSE